MATPTTTTTALAEIAAHPINPTPSVADHARCCITCGDGIAPDGWNVECFSCSDARDSRIATTLPTPTALPLVTIMPPVQLRWSGRYSPTIHQVVCSDTRYSRLCRTRKEAQEFVAGLVVAGKAVLVA